MPKFAVMFRDELANGVTRVEAASAAAAEALVLDQHPGGRVHAVDGATVTEENRVLAAWMREGWRFCANYCARSPVAAGKKQVRIAILPISSLPTYQEMLFVR